MKKEGVMNALSKDEIGKMEGGIMLALSTFRRSEEAIEFALNKSTESKKLMIVHVVDVNMARYVVGMGGEFVEGLKESCEAEILEKAEKEAGEYLTAITQRAEALGIEVTNLNQVGRFALVCLEIVKQLRPAMIVTTRSRRPEWVKKFFGAPVDELILKAGCPVIAI
jgi:nucleotide-binding universal stress UspA family protein